MRNGTASRDTWEHFFFLVISISEMNRRVKAEVQQQRTTKLNIPPIATCSPTVTRGEKMVSFACNKLGNPFEIFLAKSRYSFS